MYQHVNVRGSVSPLGNVSFPSGETSFSRVSKWGMALIGPGVVFPHLDECENDVSPLGNERYVPPALIPTRITGAGSGGTVAVIGRKGSDDAVKRVADRYSEETGYAPYIFSGSSQGAATYGTVRLTV